MNVFNDKVPLAEKLRSKAGWSRDKSWCDVDGGMLLEESMPDGFVVRLDSGDGATPTLGLAVHMKHWRTIRQIQPFARCEAVDEEFIIHIKLNTQLNLTSNRISIVAHLPTLLAFVIMLIL